MSAQKNVLVCGGGGFIGSHLAKALRKAGCRVVCADLKYPEFSATAADVFHKGDLRDAAFVANIFTKDGPFDEVYQLAADMGGAGYIFTGNHDADVMSNSSQININIAQACAKGSIAGYSGSWRVLEPKTKVFYSSSACMYPAYNQEDPENPNCSEDSAYPAAPDSEYGWEKLFSERLYLSFHRNYGLPVRIARYHNIYGPEGTYTGGKEKAPAAMCRKVAELPPLGGNIEVWGDGLQTRSFLYIDECVKATLALMAAENTLDGTDICRPFNIGSEEMVTIDGLAEKAIEASAKSVHIKHVPGPLGVRGRNSCNKQFKSAFGWTPYYPLQKGVARTYRWINAKVNPPIFA